jgi:hypothetical protein
MTESMTERQAPAPAGEIIAPAADKPAAAAIPPAAALARKMYAAGDPVRHIRAVTGLSNTVLYGWLDGGPMIGPRPPAIPRRRLVVRDCVGPLRGDRTGLAARLWRTAERQARTIEQKLAGEVDAATRARETRSLALLVRILRDLAVFDAHGGAVEDEASPLAEITSSVTKIVALRTALAAAEGVRAAVHRSEQAERQRGLAGPGKPGAGRVAGFARPLPPWPDQKPDTA